jgi:hypothetical protein
MTTSDSASTAAPQSGLAASISHLQDTAKWLLTVFGAVAGFLLAGTQLSKLGQLSALDGRFFVAILAGAIALVAVVSILHAVTQVLVTPPVEIDQLTAGESHFAQRTGMTGGFNSVSDLRAFEEAARREYIEAVRKGSAEEIGKLGPKIAFFNNVVSQVLVGIRWQRTSTQFASAVNRLVGAAVVAAIALVVFAWAANPQANPLPGAFQTPADAQLSLTPAGRSALEAIVGQACVAAGQIHVVVLTGTIGGSYDVVTVPSSQCRVARLTLSDNSLGALLATVAIPLPILAEQGPVPAP